MASTMEHDRAERLSGQGWRLPRPRSFRLPSSVRLYLRGLSWRHLPLYVGLVLAASALALVAAGSVPRLFGYHTFIVYGGSMAPALRPGDVALTKPVAAEDVQVGDIIATRPNPQASPVLHRVTAIEEKDGQRQFVIKGDRNDGADPEPVLLLGSGDRVVHRVPLAGYLIHFVRTLPGRLLFLLVPTVLLGGVILWEIWRPRRAAQAPTPVPASEGATAEADPVFIRLARPQVVRAEPSDAGARAPSEGSRRGSSRAAAPGAAKGARKPRATRNTSSKGRSTSGRTSKGKSRGQRRAAA